MKYLEHKGYTGTIEYSKEDKLLFGKVIGIRGLISYEGTTGSKLEKDFKEAVNEYLEDCKQRDIEPDKPFKGSFNVRIPARLHREAALKAIELNTSLNGLVTESIREIVAQGSFPKKSTSVLKKGSKTRVAAQRKVRPKK